MLEVVSAPARPAGKPRADPTACTNLLAPVTVATDGPPQTFGRPVYLPGEHSRNTDTIVVSKIVREAAFRTERDLLKAWPVSYVQAEGRAERMTGARAHVGGRRRHNASVPLLTDDSQIGANLQVCPDEENRADWDQRG